MNAIKTEILEFNGQLLDIGCGKMPYKKYILDNSRVTKYIGLDIETALVYESGVKPDFTWDGIRMPFEQEHFETASATEVLEHCPKPEIILHEVFRVLKSGGVFFFTVPFLWPLHETPHDEYRYTPFAMERILKEAGFTNIKINAFGGWHASLAQMLGLWVRRAPIGQLKRKILSNLLKPVIALLIKKDKKINFEFTEGQMITGLYGIASKR
jgi:SAM-dependent methyltransferase